MQVYYQSKYYTRPAAWTVPEGLILGFLVGNDTASFHLQDRTDIVVFGVDNCEKLNVRIEGTTLSQEVINFVLSEGDTIKLLRPQLSPLLFARHSSQDDGDDSDNEEEFGPLTFEEMIEIMEGPEGNEAFNDVQDYLASIDSEEFRVITGRLIRELCLTEEKLAEGKSLEDVEYYMRMLEGTL